MSKQLGIVFDEVALLRQRLGGKAPDPVTAATMAELGGADACVLHLRGDRQHVQERDVRLLRQTLQARLVLRMAPRQEMLKLAYDLKPDEVTLVAERDDVPMVEPLAVAHQQESLRKVVQALIEAEMRASVLVEPSLDAVRDAHRLGVQGIVLHTRALTGLRRRAEVADERQRLEDAARAARKLGMIVQLSGGLTFEALAELGRWEAVDGFQIGHHLWARALFVGLVQAVRDARGLVGSP